MKKSLSQNDENQDFANVKQQAGKKKNRAIPYISLAFISFVLLAGVFVHYKGIFGKQKEVLGEDSNIIQDVINEDEEQTLENTEINNIENPTSEELETPTTENESPVYKPTINTNAKEDLAEDTGSTNNPAIEEEQPNYCKESDISEYRQIIATSESSIIYYEAFLANPKGIYDYTYKYNQCDWTYYDCMEAADEYFLQVTGWTYLEAPSHGCSKLPICSDALVTRTEMLQVCYSDLHQCRIDVDSWLNDQIVAANKAIESLRTLIAENQDKLSSCGF